MAFVHAISTVQNILLGNRSAPKGWEEYIQKPYVGKSRNYFGKSQHIHAQRVKCARGLGDEFGKAVGPVQKAPFMSDYGVYTSLTSPKPNFYVSQTLSNQPT